MLAVDRSGATGMTLPELKLLFDAVSETRPDLIVDWGTQHGNSARILYEATRALGLRAPVHTVELDRERGPYGRMVEGLPVVQHQGHGDRVFLELYHRYESVRPLVFLDDNHVEHEVSESLYLIHECAPETEILMHDTYPNRSQDPDRALRSFLRDFADEYTVVAVPDGQCLTRLTPRREA